MLNKSFCLIFFFKGEAKPDSTRNTLTLDGSQFRPAEQNKTHETPTVTPSNFCFHLRG